MGHAHAIAGALGQLVAMKGVNDASVYSLEHGLFSTVASEELGTVRNAAAIVEQIFSSAHSIGMAHNEISFEFDDRLIAAFEISDAVLVLLSTDRRVNLPMVSMGVKGVAGTLRELLANQGFE